MANSHDFVMKSFAQFAAKPITEKAQRQRMQIIEWLKKNPGPHSPKEICCKLQLNYCGTGKMLRRLADDGIAERVPMPQVRSPNGNWYKLRDAGVPAGIEPA